MITNFALSLSFDGIELLHRVPRGWRRVGKADVASDTLEDDLKVLREKALTIEPDGLRTKLVIPLDQIKYIALDGTMTTEADIHAALEGATPYALNELVIDSEKFGGRTHIAAVARETLREAEAFASGHGFQPVAFVAIPEPFTFQKEVFFGPTDMARSVVGPDALIERDDLPVMIVGTRIKSRLLVFDLPEEVQEDVYKDDLAALLAGQSTTTPEADYISDDVPEDTPQAEAEAENARAPEPVQPIWIDHVPSEYHAPASAAPVPLAAPIERQLIPDNPVFAAPHLLDAVIAEYHPRPPKTAKPALVSITDDGAAHAPKLGIAADRKPPRTDTPNRTRPALIAASVAAGALLIGGLIWSQQDTNDVTAIPAANPVETAAVTPETTAPAAVVPTPELTPEPVLETGPAISIIELTELRADDISPSDLPTIATDTTIPPIILPAPVIAGIADAPIGTIQPPPNPEPLVTAQASVGTPVLRGQVLSPDAALRIYEATGVWLRAPRFIDVPSGAVPLNFQPPAVVTPPERIAQPEVPPLTGLDTDLSFIAPANPPAPEMVFPLDENGFILATEEGTVTPEGALVFAGLPDLAITPRPTLDQADLDRMALLAPAPEGVIIIAGRPDFVTPLRPANAELPEPDESSAEADALATALADATPESAPAPTPGSVGIAGLELQNSGAIALDPAVVEDGAIVDLRPRLRPQGLQPAVDPGTPDITDILAGIETDDATLRFDNSTALAVVLSLRPDTRPSDFGTVVAAAQARQQTRPVTAPAPITAAAPVPPQNFEPVPGGVARAATQEDAIRLREINLIGVYGRANARRALVRLSNGRYVRVEVGSALDGGQVTAIGEDALNYVKRGRTFALEVPES